MSPRVWRTTSTVFSSQDLAPTSPSSVKVNIFQTTFVYKCIEIHLYLGAIQIIRDTLGRGGGVAKVSPNITIGGKNVLWQISLVISLVKVNKSLCHVMQVGWGVGEMSPNVTQGEGGSKSAEKVSSIIWMVP